MEPRPLGRSGLDISPITFGGMDFLGNRPENDAERVAALRAAVDHGITSIDTAPLYGFGHGEEVVGRAIADRRQRVQVLTKVGLRWDDTHGEILFSGADAAGRPLVVRRDSRPASLRTEVERSLSRLGVDVLDLVQVHHRDRQVPIPDTMGALSDLMREGKLRAIGVSNFSPAEVAEARAALGSVPLASIQDEYSLIQRAPERELFPAARSAEIGILAYTPLAQGLLTGKVTRGRRWAKGDLRHHGPLFQDANLAQISGALERVAAPIARAHGATLAQVALAWVLAQPGMTAAIAGARTPAQVAENAAAGRLALSPAEVSALGAAFAALRLDRTAHLDARRRAAIFARRVAGFVARRVGLRRLLRR